MNWWWNNHKVVIGCANTRSNNWALGEVKRIVVTDVLSLVLVRVKLIECGPCHQVTYSHAGADFWLLQMDSRWKAYFCQVVPCRWDSVLGVDIVLCNSLGHDCILIDSSWEQNQPRCCIKNPWILNSLNIDVESEERPSSKNSTAPTSCPALREVFDGEGLIYGALVSTCRRPLH